MRVLTRLAERQSGRNPKVERWLLALAAVVFIAATTVALFNLPEIPDGLRWLPLVLLVSVAVPLTVVWNGVEYSYSGRLVGLRVPIGEALRVSVLASAANLLPLPGAALVRIRALSQFGTGYGRAAGSTAVVGLAWVATSFVAAGLAIALNGESFIGVIALAVGLGGLITVAAMVLTRFSGGDASRMLWALIIIEVGFVAVLGVRMWLVLLTFGYGGFDQSFALALAAVVATASGFFPGGLGLREVLAGAVSPLVGLPPTVGVLTAAIDRVAGLAVLAAIGMIMSLLGYGTPEVPGATERQH